MMALKQVEDRPDLVKDEDTKAILNTNKVALSAYKKRREQQRTVQNMSEELNDIKNDMSEIKSLLRDIINNRTDDKGVR